MSLYHKYRPKTFSDFIGMKREAQALQLLLEGPYQPRVFLFSGPAGCGKTSMARVVASVVGSQDIREYNSADTRGIDTAREIIDNCMYVSASPVVYILDEVHQASKDFQNAMLKILEDTPQNVYFILCSSEPNKIIAAVKSRCNEIFFKPLSRDNLMRLCKNVAKAEGASVSMDALEAIAKKAGGSARDALELLQYVLANPDLPLDSLGDSMIDSTTLELCRDLLSSKDWGSTASLIANLETSDWESVRYAVLGYMTSVLLKSYKIRAALAIECFSEPFYSNGKAGLVLACYKTVRG